MRSFTRRGVVAVALVSLAASASACGELAEPSDQGREPVADASSAGSPQSNAASKPAPKPEVSVDFTGPSAVHSDSVLLRGTVEPATAHVRIKGQTVSVRHGHWKLPVTLSAHGDNSFHVVATRKGYVKDSTTVVVTRKLSAAEKAVLRQERAERRANERAVQSAQDYLAMSGMSKQGLYEQLSSSYGEGFTSAQAQYAVDHVVVDWNKEAVQSARSYLDMQPMSKAQLIDQLSSSYGEGFTYEQAVYAVNKVY
jgi:hypothetical protein